MNSGDLSTFTAPEHLQEVYVYLEEKLQESLRVLNEPRPKPFSDLHPYRHQIAVVLASVDGEISHENWLSICKYTSEVYDKMVMDFQDANYSQILKDLEIEVVALGVYQLSSRELPSLQNAGHEHVRLESIIRIIERELS